MGELETRQHDQPCRVDEREQECDSAQGDGDESGESFDGEHGALSQASFRDAGEECRDDGEEQDQNSCSSVDDVSQ